MPRRKKDEILLSEKYGVNPSIDLCFYCHESKGIILCGKLKGDKEAPKEMYSSLDPCDKCKEKYKNDTLIVEYDMENNTPTGRWMAIDKQYITDEDIKNSQVALATPPTFNSLLEGDTNNDIQGNEA